MHIAHNDEIILTVNEPWDVHEHALHPPGTACTVLFAGRRKDFSYVQDALIARLPIPYVSDGCEFRHVLAISRKGTWDDSEFSVDKGVVDVSIWCLPDAVAKMGRVEIQRVPPPWIIFRGCLRTARQ